MVDGGSVELSRLGAEFHLLFKEYKLTSVVFLLLIAVSAYYVARLQQGENYAAYLGYVSSSSIIFFSMVFVGTGTTLIRRYGLGDLDTFVISLATTVSLIWTYELIFHYSFPVHLNYYRFPYFLVDLRNLIMMGSLSILILVGRRYIRLKRNHLFFTLIILFTLTYGLWLMIGFPNSDGNLYQPIRLAVGDPFALGAMLSRLSKFLLSISWILLYASR